MSLEKWASIASVGLYAMFVGEMISIYYFMTDIPANFEFAVTFEPTPKILQFISIDWFYNTWWRCDFVNRDGLLLYSFR